MNTQTALEIIADARPSQARTFDSTDGTVEVWKMVYHRRNNGQIIGLNDGTAKPHRVTLRKSAVEVAQEIEDQAANRLMRAAEYEAGLARDRAKWSATAAKTRLEIADLEFARALVTHPAAAGAIDYMLDIKRGELATWEGYLAG